MNVKVEVREPMGHEEAERHTAEIRRRLAATAGNLEAVCAMLTEAWRGQAWKALGYANWDAYVEAELRSELSRLVRAARGQWVRPLYEQGMSMRAIAAAFSVDHKTVAADLRRGGENSPPAAAATATKGLDGKTYPRRTKPKQRARQDPDPAQRVDRELQALQKAAVRVRRLVAAAPDAFIDRVPEIREILKVVQGTEALALGTREPDDEDEDFALIPTPCASQTGALVDREDYHHNLPEFAFNILNGRHDRMEPKRLRA